MPQSHYLVPDQSQGFEKNIEHSALLDTTDDAEDSFVGAKERLLDVNNWNSYIGGGISLQLTDIHDKVLHRKAHKGDRIKIATVPALHLVLVEAIEYDDYPDEGRETFAVRLKQDDGATATIVIERTHKSLAASFHGRNDATLSIGLTDEQWGSLVKGLLGDFLQRS